MGEVKERLKERLKAAPDGAIRDGEVSGVPRRQGFVIMKILRYTTS
jgi:hypothetical protein